MELKIKFNKWELKMLYHFCLRELDLHDTNNWETEEEANTHLKNMERLENKLGDSWKVEE